MICSLFFCKWWWLLGISWHGLNYVIHKYWYFPLKVSIACCLYQKGHCPCYYGIFLEIFIGSEYPVIAYLTRLWLFLCLLTSSFFTPSSHTQGYFTIVVDVVLHLWCPLSVVHCFIFYVLCIEILTSHYCHMILYNVVVIWQFVDCWHIAWRLH